MSHQALRNVLVSLVLAGGMWCYALAVLVPFQKSEAIRTRAPRGNLSDLYPRWLGAREWVLHGRDPYSAEVTRKIQAGYWGRPLDTRNPTDPKDEARFAHPAYTVFLLTPFVWLPFPVVRVLFIVLLAACTVASVLFWSRVLHLQLKGVELAAPIILTLGSWPVVQGLLLQQLTLLVAFLVAGSALALASGRLGAAGLLLGLATIKPQLALPVAAWYMLWMLGDWRHRRRIGWSFLATCAGLFAVAQWAMPGWFTRWLDSLGSYLQYSEAEPLLQTLLGHGAGTVLRLLIVGAVAWFCWTRRRPTADSPEFGVVLSLVLVAALLTLPRWASYDQVLLLPVALLIGCAANESRTSARAMRGLCIASVGWQWGAALVLALLSFAYPILAQRLSVAPLVTTLALPVAALCALALRLRRDGDCRPALTEAGTLQTTKVS